jgi:hypothetical protein
MRSIIAVLAGTSAIGLSAVGVAQAAAPPIPTAPPHARSVAAADITTSGAVLRGYVNAKGTPSTFAFDYGPTSAYGAATAARNAGAAKGATLVHQAIAGLAPGTTYHFEITAANAYGATTGGDVTFTTKGSPPSTVYTGPPTIVGDTSATVSGDIDPNGAATSWVVQYGTTTSYGSQSFYQSLPAGDAAVPVQLQLSSLSPQTLFHYRLVSYHGTVASYGADQTFFTRPTDALPAQMTTRITPSHDRRSPYRFTASGTLKGGTSIPSAQRCSGTVAIRYYNGRHQLGTAFVAVNASCQFSGTTTFGRLDGSGPVKLRVSVFYRGNGYLNKESKIDHPVAGR